MVKNADNKRMQSKRILVVDDEPLVTESIQFMLSNEHHVADIAASGEEAWEKVQTRNFDLVMTDYNMPGMKGDQLAKAIKSRHPHQPILLLTGFARAASAFQVDLIVEKPCSMQKLREALSKVFEPRIHPDLL
ncbi:MAG TPA: response regulator [Candidatus Saccharimonadales bacterium]|nr:response regulator [Candidatus Saccharimonadales bacterium]